MRIYEDCAYGDAPIARSFWSTTTEPYRCPQLAGAVECETVIIGCGYTGLNAALTLAQSGQDVVILDGHQPGWGASGRNGGFCCLGGAKLSLEKMTKKYGFDLAQAYARAEIAAVDHVANLLEAYGIDADTHSDGETLMAHRPKDAQVMQAQEAAVKQAYGDDATYIPKQNLPDHGLNSPEFYGALTIPVGFALNPMKYVLGLTRVVAQQGARIFGDSAVCQISTDQAGRHVVKTNQGEVSARNLIVATNGYSSDDLPKWLAGRYLPVQSNIVVTRPLSEKERKAQGWTSRQMCYDTRNLLHYFRLLPDNRFLLGTRGAVQSSEAAFDQMKNRASRDLRRMFPAWADVEVEHDWSGFVNLARNLTPFVGPIPGMTRAWASMAYHGNGVAMGSFSGHMIAGQVVGDGALTPEILRVPLRRFELGRFRRWSLSMAYLWYGLQDR